MNPSNKRKFAEAMGIMGEAFQKRPSDTLTDVYWRVLQDMPIETFERACLTLINTRTITGTFPMVAEIREAANGKEDIEGRITTAWDKLMFAVERHGPYETIIFDDAVIHQILKSWGGWIKWASEITNDQLKWARKDFAALYKSYATMPLPAPEPMEGITENDNRNRGYLEHIPSPIYITGQVGAFKSLPYQEQQQKKLEVLK